MKKLLSTFAAVGLLSFTACAAEEEEPVIIDEPVVEEPAPAPLAPPATMDTTMMMDSTMVDTVVAP